MSADIKTEDDIKRLKCELASVNAKLFPWSAHVAMESALTCIEQLQARIADLEAAVLAAQSPQVAITVTDEMVKAYLAANDKYWHESDAMPRTSPSKFRNGTPMEATRVSLEAALAVLQQQSQEPSKSEVQ